MVGATSGRVDGGSWDDSVGFEEDLGFDRLTLVLICLSEIPGARYHRRDLEKLSFISNETT